MGPAVEAQKAEDAEQSQQQNQLQELQCYLEKGVKLEPFLHQVGGHCCVLCLREQTICKPLDAQELRFYENLPAVLRKFTPQYRGLASVRVEEDEEGNHCFVAYPFQIDSAEDVENTEPKADSKPKSKMNMWEKMMGHSTFVDGENDSVDGQRRHSCQDQDNGVHEVGKLSGALYYKLERSHSNAAPQLRHNPWTQQSHTLRMKYKPMYLETSNYKFILLENLTWRHTMPCVLDLKMGSRQHGDCITENKLNKKIQDYKHSTVHTIGASISGMQVYQVDTGRLIFINKYKGSKLSVPVFREALFQFFHSGLRLRRELFPPVLRSLRELQAALETCESYRFFCSSLLIIYDGAHHQKHCEDGRSEEDEEGDEGVEVEAEHPRRPSTSSDGSIGDGSSGASQAPLSRSDPCSPVVDVRMIDFAHTTCKYYQGEKVLYEGPPSDLILGLQNLINIISELENHSTD